MNAPLLALLVASSPAPAAAPAVEDLRCYRLMAELARSDDPAVRTLGLTAAQYFLGRIDAASPGYDASATAAVAEAERAPLVRRCAEALGANGFDLRALGESLTRPEPTV